MKLYSSSCNPCNSKLERNKLQQKSKYFRHVSLLSTNFSILNATRYKKREKCFCCFRGGGEFVLIFIRFKTKNVRHFIQARKATVAALYKKNFFFPFRPSNHLMAKFFYPHREMLFLHSQRVFPSNFILFSKKRTKKAAQWQ